MHHININYCNMTNSSAFKIFSHINTNKHLLCVICTHICIQCFDTVGWAAGRVSSL